MVPPSTITRIASLVLREALRRLGCSGRYTIICDGEHVIAIEKESA